MISHDLTRMTPAPTSPDAAIASAFAFGRFPDEPAPVRAVAWAQCSAPAQTVPGTVISRPMPAYRDDEKISGESVFRVVIGRDGLVKEATLLTGPPARKEADLRSVKQWKFEPSRRNGEPVEVSTSVAVDAEFDPKP